MSSKIDSKTENIKVYSAKDVNDECVDIKKRRMRFSVIITIIAAMIFLSTVALDCFKNSEEYKNPVNNINKAICDSDFELFSSSYLEHKQQEYKKEIQEKYNGDEKLFMQELYQMFARFSSDGKIELYETFEQKNSLNPQQIKDASEYFLNQHGYEYDIEKGYLLKSKLNIKSGEKITSLDDYSCVLLIDGTWYADTEIYYYLTD